MTLVTGFGNMKRDSEQRQANRPNGDYIKYVSLRDDGDKVLFRMVTESDVQYAEQYKIPHLFIKGEFHKEEGKSKRGVAFTRDVLCATQFNNDTQAWEGECALCKDPENRSRTQFFAWVWVYACYYKRQDERYIPGDDSTAQFKRKQIRRGQELFFKEDVNQYRIWQDGYYMLEQIQGKAARFGPLCDRDYTVTRHGVRRSPQTQRILEEQSPTALLDEIREGAWNLPELADVASNKVRTLGGTPTSQEVPGEVDISELEDELGASVGGFEDLEEVMDTLDEAAVAVAVASDPIFEEETSPPDTVGEIFADLEAIAMFDATHKSDEEIPDDDHD